MVLKQDFTFLNIKVSLKVENNLELQRWMKRRKAIIKDILSVISFHIAISNKKKIYHIHIM